jgi:hypothetical protein
MKTTRAILALAILAVVAFAAINGQQALAVFTLFLAGHAIASWNAVGPRLCVTLTSTEILRDVIKSFKKTFPALNRMGNEFRATSLKLDQQYIAHIPTLPTVEDVTATYATTGQTARSLLVDVPVTVSRRRGVRLKWEHVAGLQDQKNEYDECIQNAGFALAKNFVDDLLSEAKSTNFSQYSIFAEADCDLDMLANVRGDMNGVGANPMGRAMLVNSNVASVLEVDTRIASKDYYGQNQAGADGLRSWRGVAGFSEILEYADLSLNNGTALTAVATDATGGAYENMFTKTAHGLVTGDRVTAASFSAGTGLTTTGGTYFVIKKTADVFQLATTRALAVAGTAFTVSADGTGGVVTLANNLVGFAFERNAISFLAGIPDNFDHQALKSQLNIPENMGFEAVTYEGITMGAVSWQDVGTGDLTWMPVLVWGKALGAQGGANADGSKCDYAGHLIIKA